LTSPPDPIPSSYRRSRHPNFYTTRDGTPSFTIPDWLDCTLEVTNEAGETVLILPFTEAVEKV
jgi:hypothetical protein